MVPRDANSEDIPDPRSEGGGGEQSPGPRGRMNCVERATRQEL